jgi:hypothetical protein
MTQTHTKSAKHSNGASSHGREHLGDSWRFVQGLPRTAQATMKANPAAVVAGVGATAFVLGALCGSRIGRVLLTTLAGYGLRRLLEGPVGEEVARYAKDVVSHTHAGA